jgi:PAS domain S-box-containing protein
MKNVDMNKHTVVGFLLALILLVGGSVVVYGTTRRLADNGRRVAHTYEVLKEISEMLTTLQAAETGQRGYLLTGQEPYLEPYRRAIDRVYERLHLLRQLTRDHPDHRRRLDALAPRIAGNLAELDESIRLYQGGDAEKARKLTLTGRGREGMDAIRRLLGEMTDEEEHLQKERFAESEDSLRLTFLTFVVVVLLGVILLGLSFWLLRRDIRERERAEDALRAERERFRVTLASIGDGVLVTDTEGRVTFLNEAARTLTGHDDTVRGRPSAEVFPILNETTRQPVEDPVRRVLREGGVVELANHTLLIARDGTERPIEDTAAPIRDERGEVRGVVLVFHDVSQRRRLEAQFLQAQKMEAVGRLAGGVAHDFNNLLTVILGYSDAVLSGLPPEGPVRAMVEEVSQAGQRAAGLTRQLLAFSRQQLLEPRVLDLNTVVNGIEKMLGRLIGEDVSITCVLDPDLGRVRADPGQIEQVLMNLAVNARDAMPQGGRLTIETANVRLDETYTQSHPEVRPGRYVMLSLTDTGVGMDETTKARLFEPFFTTKEVGRGTGLGLATVYGIVKQSGGSIFVYSEPNRGTSFKIYLPRLEAVAPLPKSNPGLVKSSGGGETILLVEDEEAVRTLTRQVLESKGYTAIEARDGQDALHRAERYEGPIHLLLTDVVMPHLGGRELADRLKVSRPGLRVLYLSGYTDDAVVRHGVLEADVAFLQKPFTPAELARKVREVLDGPPANPDKPGAMSIK